MIEQELLMFDLAERLRNRYYGKYRGTVVNNIDPMQIGRIQAIVPDVGIVPTSWAMPCLPGAGINTGVFTVQTTLKNGIVVSDVPGPTGGILIQTTTGAMISVSDVGITISNGKGAVISMLGPTVDVNAGALTVV